MKNYSRLSALPLGSITAEGWLREQLERNRDGMGGHLGDLEPQMIWDPYVTKKTDDAWGNVKAGWGAEISGNYWFGLIGLAYALHDVGLMRKADEWVEAMMKNAEPEGYLGAYRPEDDRMEDYNPWGTSNAMKALLEYWEATGRQEVFDAVYNCMLWFCKNWAGDNKTRYAAATIIDPMMTCYHVTGDERLLQFCIDFEEFLAQEDLYMNSVKAFAAPKLQYNSNHTSAYVAQVRLPAMIYSGSGDEYYLQASVNGIDKLRRDGMHTTGAPVCNNEYLAPVSVYAESEYCSFAFLASSYAAMSVVTGNTIYGDYLEELVFNAAEGARMNNERAIQYNSTPNQIYISESGSHFYGVHLLFAPIHPTSCCAVNSVVILPEFVRHLALTDAEGNLHINAYAPCTIRHRGVTLACETLYPFRENITYRVTAETPQQFKLFLKKPYWCESWEYAVNGETNGSLDRTWHTGDVVTIHLSMKPVVSRVHDLPKNEPLAIRWGALSFSLPIEENWVNLGNGHARTPLPEGWAWYSVMPVIHALPAKKFEDMGYRKKYITWNVALAENELDIAVEELTPSCYVWEKPPVKLHLKGYKAPFAYAPYPRKTSEIYEAELDVTDKLDLTLVPYGSTALRITYFPRAKKS